MQIIHLGEILFHLLLISGEMSFVNLLEMVDGRQLWHWLQ